MRQKINWILILQGWAMLWVVIGHSPMRLESMTWYEQITFNFAYSFHMPLFFAISGFLFYMTRIAPKNNDGSNKWNWGNIMKDKLIRLGVPFVVFTVLAMFLKTLFPGDMDRPTNISITTVVDAILYPGCGPLGELWFVGVLFWMFALYPFWNAILEQKVYVFFTGVLVAFLHFLHFDMPLLSISNACYYAIWFYAGMMVCRYMPKNMGGWFCLLVGGILYTILSVFNLSFLMTVSAIFASYGLALLLDKFWPSIFSSFRNYTYQIFLMGIFAQIAIKMIFKRVDIPHSLSFAICILAGIYFPVIVAMIIQKINNKYLCLCIGLKKQNKV